MVNLPKCLAILISYFDNLFQFQALFNRIEIIDTGNNAHFKKYFYTNSAMYYDITNKMNYIFSNDPNMTSLL